MKRILLLAAVVVLPMTAAVAQESAFGKISGYTSFEAQNDWTFDSDTAGSEKNTLHGEIESGVKLSLTEKLALESTLILEEIQATDADDDTIFDNHGAYVEELKLTYDADPFTIFAGKYNPSFGTAWDLTPGVYGTDFAEDYEMTERVGFGGIYTVGNAQTGNHTVTANTFFADTSVLSESIFTTRDQTDIDDGGLSNTEDLSSYSVTLDSEKIAGIDGLNSHIGYVDQAAGDADTGLDNETGYVLGANYTTALSENIEAMALVEWADFNNSAGEPTDDKSYLTTGIGLTINEKWNLALSSTQRDTEASGVSDVNDDMMQISAGYAFDNGVGLDIGYRQSEEDGDDTSMLGALVTYGYEF